MMRVKSSPSEASLSRIESAPEEDAAAREAVYREAYRLLQDDPPWLYLYNHTRRIALAAMPPGFAMPDDGVLDVRRLIPARVDP